MTVTEALELASDHGVQVTLGGDDLVLEADARPPDEFVAILAGDKFDLVAALRQRQAEERRRVVQWVNDHFVSSPAGLCAHCGEGPEQRIHSLCCSSEAIEATCTPHVTLHGWRSGKQRPAKPSGLSRAREGTRGRHEHPPVEFPRGAAGSSAPKHGDTQLTDSLFCRREPLERGRQIRKDKLIEYQTAQARRLELIEKFASWVDGAFSSLKTEINDERIVVHITSRFEGVPDVHLELCCDGASDLVEDDGIPF